DADQLDDFVAQARRPHIEVEFLGPRRSRRPTVDERGRARDAGLRLPGPRGGTAPQPRQHPPGEVAARALRAFGLLLTLGPSGEVGGVAAFVDERSTAVELEDAGGDPIEDVAVMSDED